MLSFSIAANAQSKSQKNAVSTQKLSKRQLENKAIRDYNTLHRVDNPAYKRTLKLQDKKTKKRIEKTKKKARKRAIQKSKRR